MSERSGDLGVPAALNLCKACPWVWSFPRGQASLSCSGFQTEASVHQLLGLRSSGLAESGQAAMKWWPLQGFLTRHRLAHLVKLSPFSLVFLKKKIAWRGGVYCWEGNQCLLGNLAVRSTHSPGFSLSPPPQTSSRSPALRQPCSSSLTWPWLHPLHLPWYPQQISSLWIPRLRSSFLSTLAPNRLPVPRW